MFFFGGQGANLTMANSIVADNTAGTFGPDLIPDFAGTRTIKFSLIGDENGSGLTASTSPDANGNLIGPHASPIDPKLGPLADNGGRTKTHTLLPGSPALDGGDPNFDAAIFTAAGFAGPFVFDERGDGFARLMDGGGSSQPIVDIGAYESQGAPIGYPTGDYNQDGAADAADYVFWRKAINTPSTYSQWRSNFGNSSIPTSTPVSVPLILPLSGPTGDDGIANGAEAVNQNGPLGIDGVGSLLVTSTFSVQNGGNGLHALPTSGFFPSDVQHFDIQLMYRDANNTNSVLRLDAAGETAEISVPDGTYAQLDLVVTSGDGPTPLSVTLRYGDGTQTTLLSTAPDWFDDPAGLTASNSIAQGDARLYFLQNDMDRVNGLTHTYQASNDPAIFGLRFAVNAAKTLQSISVAKTDASGSKLIVLGGAVSHAVVSGAGSGEDINAANSQASMPPALKAVEVVFATYPDLAAATTRLQSVNEQIRLLPISGQPRLSEQLLLVRDFGDHSHTEVTGALHLHAIDDWTESEINLGDAWNTFGNSLRLNWY